MLDRIIKTKRRREPAKAEAPPKEHENNKPEEVEPPLSEAEFDRLPLSEKRERIKKNTKARA